MAAPKGNKYAIGNEGGRPAFFETAEQLQKKIDQYFNEGCLKDRVTALGGRVKIPYPTICGLALYLGFSSRQSLSDYAEKQEFVDIIKKAKLRIEQNYEEMLHKGQCTGSIFALKNMGWHDKVETEHSGEIKGQPQIVVTNQQAAEAMKKIINDND